MITKEFTITNDIGLHARPATKLVQAASRYTSHIELEVNNKKVNVKSIMGVMSLGLPHGAQFSLIVDGSDEAEAIAGIAAFLKEEGLAE